MAGSCSPPPSAAMIAFAIAPKIATPTALPIERANMFVPVTTPRSFQPTLDCAAISVGVGDEAHPEPDDEAADRDDDSDARMRERERERRARPTIAIADADAARSLRNPMRR